MKIKKQNGFKAGRGASISALAAALMLMAAVSAVAETAGYGAADYGAAGAVGKTDLSVEQMLNYALEDEYLAHAKYDVIIKEHGNIRPFSNIIHAELRHIDWVSGLMAKYGYPVPKDDSYQYAVSPLNIKASLEACVQGEIDNINMYNMFLKQKLPGDVRDLFLELRDSSENHLRAFRNNLRRY